jgi:beta-galactosidase/beta-glucuronidase
MAALLVLEVRLVQVPAMSEAEVAGLFGTVDRSSEAASGGGGSLAAGAVIERRTVRVPFLERGETRTLDLPDIEVPQPQLWSDEAPHLYCLVVALRYPSPGGDAHAPPREVEALSVMVGLRRVEVGSEVAGNPLQLLLNGRPLLVKGVNRHEHDPQEGHVVTREAMLADVKSIKALHINAVRSAHYPNDPFWLQLCDR